MYFRLIATPPLMLILPSLLALKTKYMENIHFHWLRETVTISSDDSTPSVHSPLVAPIDEPN